MPYSVLTVFAITPPISVKDFPLSLYHISKSTSSQVCVFCTFPLLERLSLSGGKNQFLRKKHNRTVNRKALKNNGFSTKSTAFSTLLCKFAVRQKVQKTDFFLLQPTAFFLSRAFSCGENRAAADSVGSCLSQFVGRCAFEQRGVASLFESFTLRSDARNSVRLFKRKRSCKKFLQERLAKLHF
ncbi:MAG: hypothetical protein IJF15_01040 [Oscillospiraceae bacterium]|nr:hypothetical protein [Oscillospiraceae bacterium]